MKPVSTIVEPRQVAVGDVIRTLSGIVKETGRVHLVTANVAYFQCDKATCSCRLPVSDRAHASHGVWRKSTDWEIVPMGGAA